MWELYKKQPNFVLGFHGCDESVGETVLSGKGHLAPSNNGYDWLGSGIYFWEGNPARALEFAQQAATNPRITKGRITTPFVLGAVIDLGLCFNLLDSTALGELAKAHEIMKILFAATKKPLPQNIGGEDRLKRHLDRAVIEMMHVMREQTHLPQYDSLRAPFWEGGELYPSAGFSAKAHIQIAIRNVGCIKGYFRPIAREVASKRT